MQYGNKDTLAGYMNIGIIKFILLNIITLSFYSLFFQHKFNGALRKLEIQPYAEKARMRFSLMLGLWIFGILIQFIGDVSENPLLTAIGLISSLVSSVFGIIWGYDIRAGIRSYCSKNYGIDYTANAILVFFFPCLTLIYVTNNIQNEVEFRNQIESHKRN